MVKCKKVTAQIFVRLSVHEFASKFLKTCNIDNIHYEIYISMMTVMQIFIVTEIQLFTLR